MPKKQTEEETPVETTPAPPEIQIAYRKGAARFELRVVNADGSLTGPARPATIEQVLAYESLVELRAIRAAVERD